MNDRPTPDPARGAPHDAPAARVGVQPPSAPRGDRPQHAWGHHLLMVAMCLPVLVLVGVLVAGGVAGGGAVVYALLCAAMMAVMMVLMSGHRH